MTITTLDTSGLRRRWVITTESPTHGVVRFTVFGPGGIAEVDPPNSQLAAWFSSIEGFDQDVESLDLPPRPTEPPDVALEDAIAVGRRPRDVTGYYVVAYPKFGPGRYLRTDSVVVSIRRTTDHPT